jgi:serine/threonine-protein kinase RsbT
MPADLPTRDVLDAVMTVLTRYCPRPTAQSVLNVARQRTGVSSAQITRDQLFDMLDPIERSLDFFISDPVKAKSCRRALEALTSAPSGPAPPGATAIPIRVEDDIVRARNEARRLAIVQKFTLVGQTRLMTAVSELARNIVQYAGEGYIELLPSAAPAGIEIVARDRGPGIPNLDRIMAGNYRSRLGMGLGLRGVKQLAERFDVRTEAGRGTTVTALLRQL